MNERYIVRGLTIGGEWVYGYLSILDKKIHYGVDIPAGYYISNEAGKPFAYPVRPETVGKPTTLKDKNGNLVFEGDIIKYDDTEEMSFWTRGEIGVVKFKPGRFSICLSPDYDGKMTGTSNMMQEDMEDCITIIGNIHQNSELLEKGGK